MKKIVIAILGPSEIAFRRFMPSLELINEFEFYGVAVATKKEKEIFLRKEDVTFNSEVSFNKAKKFTEVYGGKVISSYYDLLDNNEIDAIYIPLPPGIHHFWAMESLKRGKHLLVEKPFTLSLENTTELVEIAKKSNLALIENYGFEYHKQLKLIEELISRGEIGKVRQIRTYFGFPHRGDNDFRYNKHLGGGSLFECAGYPIKLSTILLGNSVKVVSSVMSNDSSYEIDIFGSLTIIGKKNITSHISYGMDNFYKCELEIWGSKGIIYSPRIFTAPSNCSVEISIQSKNSRTVHVEKDDHFVPMIRTFYNAITSSSTRVLQYDSILIQANLVQNAIEMSVDN